MTISKRFLSPILDVADLERHPTAAWFGLQQHVIDEAIDQWRRLVYRVIILPLTTIGKIG